MISEDQMFERIVAAVCRAGDSGAEVKWNYKVGGRQFDVAIFSKSGLFKYFTLIEAKSSKNAIKVKEIEAFVTKGKDKGANKLAVFSAHGFESGCIEVAKRHRIDLFKLSFSDAPPSMESLSELFKGSTAIQLRDPLPGEKPTIEFGEPQECINITKATLIYTDKRRIDIPDEPSQFSRVLKTTLVNGKPSLEKIFDSFFLTPGKIGEECHIILNFGSPIYIKPIESYFVEEGWIKAVELDFKLSMGYGIGGNILIDPTALVNNIVVHNIISSEAENLPFYALSLGIDQPIIGKYYFIPAPLMYYCCDSIKNGYIRMIMIETYQFGKLGRAVITMEENYGRMYIPVNNNKILQRLKERHKQYLDILASEGKPLKPFEP